MEKTVPMIGIAPQELPWMRLLVQLLRHPDPGVPELVRQALLYLSESSKTCQKVQTPSRNSVG